MDPEPPEDEQRLSEKIRRSLIGKPLDLHTVHIPMSIDTAKELVRNIVREYPRATVFAGRLVFRSENPFPRILNNESAYTTPP